MLDSLLGAMTVVSENPRAASTAAYALREVAKLASNPSAFTLRRSAAAICWGDPKRRSEAETYKMSVAPDVLSVGAASTSILGEHCSAEFTRRRNAESSRGFTLADTV